MESFLASVAKDVTSIHTDFLKLVFVVPGKRAGTFLQKELLSVIPQTTFSPKIISVEEFVEELSNLKLISNLQLLFEFYEVYKKLNEAPEDFYSFNKWAQVLLQDFNEIDRYLIPPKKIFNYIYSVKDIDHWSNQENKTELQENYMKFWKDLDIYYTGFTHHLLSKKKGYQGLIYREAIENIEFYLQNNDNHHVFVGFNALNNAEERLIQEFLHNGNASIYWDTDEHFINDPVHDAGLFMRRYKSEWKFFNYNPFRIISSLYNTPKSIQLIGVPKNISQVKYAGKILQNLSSEQFQSLAVILADETLLTPFLNSVPQTIEKVNVTCGFKLQHTPLASFFSTIIELLEERHKNTWYYKKVIAFFSHPVSRNLFTNEKTDYSNIIIENIQLKNITRVDLKTITESLPEPLHNIIKLVFYNEETHNISQTINNIISLILKVKPTINDPVFLEYLFRFYEVFNQLLLLNTTYHNIPNIKTLRGVYQEILNSESIDFKGEPLDGLQVMGVLESRNIDFETVIITSVNEGILPSGKSYNSFIPFEIKQEYGLPSHKEKDAIYTYHFYRLLQRAKNIYIIYNTEPDVLEGGEKSRFIRQIIHQNLPNHTIKEIIASPEVYFEEEKLLEIHKNAQLINKLKEIAEKGFSPSTLSNYMRNPIDFYDQVILNIKKEEEVEETIALNTLGTVVHNTLEELYKPLTGKILNTQLINEMKPKIEDIIRLNFEKVYKAGDITKGKNLISLNVCRRYIENFLNFETQRLNKGDKIKILHIESNLKIPLNISGLNFPVFLKGKVDRVEEVNGIINVIDYKTGKVSTPDIEITEWENLTEDYKNSKAFQLLCYSYMINEEKNFEKPAGAGIISFKNLQHGVMQFATKETSRSRNKETIINKNTLEIFKKELHKLILEIFNPDIPFIEKEV
ncbi:PD-(D/E)XK nuclease family protein [Abyssalbus ytuae]|uniref:PD-(D/E)XK nuclease family protein n=1 Tax=Abyssalbus ytuae TaxID=2926907 RepID=A0A9E6ZWX5_9FLAO|nr:PD-(D/E)XK nuclease family protein [Abyssalbus ytuae]UOB19258.1 PD-(D/E)XK nuclease family protein [Abyssalbus ytuae]